MPHFWASPATKASRSGTRVGKQSSAQGDCLAVILTLPDSQQQLKSSMGNPQPEKSYSRHLQPTVGETTSIVRRSDLVLAHW